MTIEADDNIVFLCMILEFVICFFFLLFTCNSIGNKIFSYLHQPIQNFSKEKIKWHVFLAIFDITLFLLLLLSALSYL